MTQKCDKERPMVKIKEYLIQKQGQRGRVLTLPKVWIDDNDLEFGDSIEYYRGEIAELEGRDVLVLAAKKTGPNDEVPA